jgi:predicted flap endonuclease-1-like 5' DNA nuclease
VTTADITAASPDATETALLTLDAEPASDTTAIISTEPADSPADADPTAATQVIRAPGSAAEATQIVPLPTTDYPDSEATQVVPTSAPTITTESIPAESDPVATEPEPAAAEPATAYSATAEPAAADSALAEPAAADSALADSAITDSAVTDSAVTDSAVTEPVVADTAVAGPNAESTSEAEPTVKRRAAAKPRTAAKPRSTAKSRAAAEPAPTAEAPAEREPVDADTTVAVGDLDAVGAAPLNGRAEPDTTVAVAVPGASETDSVEAAPVAVPVAEPAVASADPTSTDAGLSTVTGSSTVAAPPTDIAPSTIAASVPGAAESDAVAAVPAPVAVAVSEPDDLTRIPGIGPKMAMALAASGITTYRKLADSDVPTLRAAVTSAGMRVAPTLPTWPERAKALADPAS